MTNLELVLDTIEYYKKNPRALDESGFCVYKSENGNMCAVGRWINWEKVPVEDIKHINSAGSVEGNEEMIKNLLLDEVKDIPFTLWDALQNYHDYTLSEDEDKIIREQKRMIEFWSKNLN